MVDTSAQLLEGPQHARFQTEIERSAMAATSGHDVERERRPVVESGVQNQTGAGGEAGSGNPRVIMAE